MAFSESVKISAKIMVFVLARETFWNLKLYDNFLQKSHILAAFFHQTIVFFKSLGSVKFQHYASSESSSVKKLPVSFVPFSLA